MKVFVGQVGAREYVVAAQDQAAALEALGASEELFLEGAAAEEMDPDVVEWVLSRPGTVFERPVWARRKLYDPCSRSRPCAKSDDVAVG